MTDATLPADVARCPGRNEPALDGFGKPSPQCTGCLRRVAGAYSLDADWRRTHDKLKTAIEELVADAEKWRAYKARKDAVIAAGMGRNPLRETATCDTYGVINEDGEVEYSAYWPEACHDHIKDMQIEHGIGGKWKVRALKYLPVSTPRKEST